mmetsp:Transcript_1547/g.2562  ORF Transcript_1547/g.2562 Transcript_1547/m.2562 type:complete len:267 (-) Transcript_1547:938-1738(-)
MMPTTGVGKLLNTQQAMLRGTIVYPAMLRGECLRYRIHKLCEIIRLNLNIPVFASGVDNLLKRGPQAGNTFGSKTRAFTHEFHQYRQRLLHELLHLVERVLHAHARVCASGGGGVHSASYLGTVLGQHEVEGRAQGSVPPVWVRSFVQERTHRLWVGVFATTSQLQGGQTTSPVLQIHIRPTVHQGLNRAGNTARGATMQRRSSRRILLIYVDSLSLQHLDYIVQVCVRRSIHTGHEHAIHVAKVPKKDICPIVDQQKGCLCMPHS